MADKIDLPLALSKTCLLQPRIVVLPVVYTQSAHSCGMFCCRNPVSMVSVQTLISMASVQTLISMVSVKRSYPWLP